MIDTTDWQARLVSLLSIPGMLLAYYLLLFHNGQLIVTCPVSAWEDCGRVSGPEGVYSSVGPIPVALIGLIGYLTIFAVIWLRDWLPVVDDYLPEALIGLTGLAFLFSVGLTALEAFVIGAFCRYCLISAAIITTMLILSLSFLRARNRASLPEGELEPASETVS